MGCRRADDALRIEVWDTGPGIAREHYRRIFLEFQRLDTGGQAEERGAGLGLAIVERIAKRLGHRIGLRSWPGRGSVFSVDVPLVDAARAPAAQEPQSSRGASVGATEQVSPLHGYRVWSVEDDPRVRLSLQTLLSGWGCEVVLAASAEEALRAANQEAGAPDLLLLDHHLPDGSGPEVVPELFRRWGAEAPVIMLSAERDSALREKVQANGWAFLSKPVNPAKLRAAVTHMLMKSAASA
jgi:histidine kinase